MNVNGTLEKGRSTGVLRSSHILDILWLEVVRFAKELDLECKKKLPRFAWMLKLNNGIAIYWDAKNLTRK